MPTTTYSEAEYRELQLLFVTAQAQLNTLEMLRPQWAMGYTSDSMAAQATAAAIQQVWSFLKVENQSDCMDRIENLVTRSRELMRLKNQA